MTRQRDAIARALDAAAGFRSAQQLYADLRRGGERVGLTTVYRTLQAMADQGEVDALRAAGGETLYRRCGGTHHHHLVCRRCGRTVEVVGPAVEDWADGVAAAHGFREVEHSLEVVGTCPTCATPPS